MNMQPVLIPHTKDEDREIKCLKVIEATRDLINENSIQPTTEVMDAYNAMSIIENYAEVAIDLETTGLNYMLDQIHGIALGVEGKEWYMCGKALYPALAWLKDSGKNPDILWVGHNIKFDMHFLQRYGVTLNNVADTQIAQWLVDENSELALKSLAKIRLGYRHDLPDFGKLQGIIKVPMGYKKMEDVSIYDIPLDVLADYGARDARLTLELWQVLKHDLEVEGMSHNFFNIEMPFLKVLLGTENNGLYIDQYQVNVLEREFRGEMDRLLEEWNSLTGGVNPNSVKQLSKLLFEEMKLPVQDKTDKGTPKTDALTLQRLVGRDPSGAIAALMKYRKFEKLMSTYIYVMMENVVDGRLHGSFNQTGTVTGRLSSNNPNLQNIPARGKEGSRLREAFVAERYDREDGYEFVVCDYSQIELRMLAHCTQDDAMIKTFVDDGDPHQLTADKAGVERYIGKTLNFAMVYGAGPRTIADTIEKTGKERPKVGDVRQWLDDLMENSPDFKKWKYSVIDDARRDGFIKTIGGRKRRLPEINHFDKGLRAASERYAVNSLIQGSCADLIKDAMLSIHPLLNQYGAKMLAQVHDELVFEVPKRTSSAFMDTVKEVMESVQSKYNISVPIKAEPGHGISWSDAK